MLNKIKSNKVFRFLETHNYKFFVYYFYKYVLTKQFIYFEGYEARTAIQCYNSRTKTIDYFYDFTTFS
jgi:hypothetical protein